MHCEEHDVDVGEIGRGDQSREARDGVLIGWRTVDTCRKHALLVGGREPAATGIVRDDLVTAAA